MDWDSRPPRCIASSPPGAGAGPPATGGRLRQGVLGERKEGVTSRQFQGQLLEDQDGVVPLLQPELFQARRVEGRAVRIPAEIEGLEAAERPEERGCNDVRSIAK